MILAFRFHPTKGFKLRWDLAIIIFSIYNSFVIPLEFSIPKTFEGVALFTVGDSIIDILFLLDIAINFRTKYIDPKTEELISDSKKIAVNYLKGRLVIDILASFPFDFFASLFSAVTLDSNTSNLMKLFKLTRLLRLGRMVSYFQVNQNFKFGMKML